MTVRNAPARAAGKSGHSGRGAAVPDNVWEVWDVGLAGDCQSGAEIIPECNAELGAGFGEAEEGVATVSPGITSCAAADFSLGDLASDVVLRAVGVERNFGSFEHHQQLGLVGVKACEQPIEGDEAGTLVAEDAIEPRPQGGLATG